jgi:predicted aldo/keto reductase-like oxidoreductase
MRFPTKDGKIDYDAAEKLLLKAADLGVNYFDTAYIYHDGESESVVGRVFAENGIRDKIKIATKLPLFKIKKAEEFDKIFDDQLKKLRTDYVDYYLLHSIMGLSQYEKFKAMGVLEWAERQVANGKIKNLGFSYHGNKDEFLQILEDYDWKFVQIQYNYLDENFQAGKAGLYRAKELGIPVVVMEPLQGGNITNKLPDDVKKFWENTSPKRSLAEWGLKWVWNQEGVSLLLSGMSNMEQLTENCAVASDSPVGCLGENELEYYAKAKLLLSSLNKIPCTACQYCVPVCPKHINIPACFTNYNKKFANEKNKEKKIFERVKRSVLLYVNHMSDTKASTKSPSPAASCISCRSCERHCPQGIKISEELKKVAKELEGPFFSLVKIGGKFILK